MMKILMMQNLRKMPSFCENDKPKSRFLNASLVFNNVFLLSEAKCLKINYLAQRSWTAGILGNGA